MIHNVSYRHDTIYDEYVYIIIIYISVYIYIYVCMQYTYIYICMHVCINCNIYIYVVYIISVFQRINPWVRPDFSKICTASQPLWPLGSYSQQWIKVFWYTWLEVLKQFSTWTENLWKTHSKSTKEKGPPHLQQKSFEKLIKASQFFWPLWSNTCIPNICESQISGRIIYNIYIYV